MYINSLKQWTKSRLSSWKMDCFFRKILAQTRYSSLSSCQYSPQQSRQNFRLISPKNDPYSAFVSYNASYRHGHISEDSVIPTRSSYGKISCIYKATRTIQNIKMKWHWITMDPSGHELHNISMFMNTMWRVGCPYAGGSAKINPDNYNGDWQDSKKK